MVLRGLQIFTIFVMLWTIGFFPPTVTAVAASAYKLPVAGGQKIYVTQGNNEGDHNAQNGSQWAIDFGNKGKSFGIVAARGGKVIGLQGDSSIQCQDMDHKIDGSKLEGCWTRANFVLIDHGDSTASLYVHLQQDSVTVKVGEQVQQGQPLAMAGTTGWSTGIHLHFQIETTPCTQQDEKQRQKCIESPAWWWTQSVSVSFADKDVLQKHSDGVPTSTDNGNPYISDNALSQAGSDIWVTKQHSLTTIMPGNRKFAVVDFTGLVKVEVDGNKIIDTAVDGCYVNSLWLWPGKHTYKVSYLANQHEPKVEQSWVFVTPACGNEPGVAQPTQQTSGTSTGPQTGVATSSATQTQTAAATATATPSPTPTPTPMPIPTPTSTPSPTPIVGGGGVIAYVGVDYKSIWVINPDGTDNRILRQESDTVDSLAWSPDGRSLAYQVSGDGSSALSILDVQSTMVRSIATDSTVSGPLAFSPDGKTIVGVGASVETSSVPMAYSPTQLVRVDLATGHVTPLIQVPFSIDGPIRYTPDGSALIVSGGASEPSYIVARVALPSGEVTSLVPPAIHGALFPAISSDGAALAYVAGVGVGREQIIIAKSDGSNPHPIYTFTHGGSGSVDFSPDGQKLAFDNASSPPSGTTDGIWLVGTDGSNPHRIAVGSTPAWQPVSIPVSDALVTPAPTPTPVPTPTPSPSENINFVTDPAQIVIIEDQIRPQIALFIGVPSYTVSKIKEYGNTWAIMRITNPTTDPANVIIEEIDGAWKAIAGPTTHFPVNRLQELHVPQVVIDDANTSLGQ